MKKKVIIAMVAGIAIISDIFVGAFLGIKNKQVIEEKTRIEYVNSKEYKLKDQLRAWELFCKEMKKLEVEQEKISKEKLLKELQEELHKKEVEVPEESRQPLTPEQIRQSELG